MHLTAAFAQDKMKKSPFKVNEGLDVKEMIATVSLKKAEEQIKLDMANKANDVPPAYLRW